MRFHRLLPALLLVLPGTLAAQAPNASAAATGMAGAYTAAARGFNAVAWNPANLALGGPKFSFIIAAPDVRADLAPLTIKDLADAAGTDVSVATRQAWLDKITANGGEHASVGAQVTELAFQAGPIAVQVATTVRAKINLAPDAADLVFFGNANRASGTYTLQNSEMTAAAATSMSASYGWGKVLPAGRLAIGVTGRYIRGHFLAHGRDSGSQFKLDPTEITVDFPLVYTDTSALMNAGSGFATDLGAAWQMKKWTFGATVRNLTNTFAWDAAGQRFRDAKALINADTSDSNADEQPLSAAPASLRDEALGLKDGAEFSFGAAYRYSKRVTVAGDVKLGAENSLSVEPARRFGIGAEVRPLSFLPIRGGVAKTSDGVEVAYGAGFELGGLTLGVGCAQRNGAPRATINLVGLLGH